MKHIYRIVPITFLLALQFECTDNQSPTTQTAQSSPFMPLTNGNHWEYSDSTIYSSDSVSVNHYSWSIVGKQKILSGTDSVEVSIFRLTFSDGTSYDYFERNDPEGLTQYITNEGDSVGQYNLKSLLIKYPLQRGDTWKTNNGDYSSQKACLSTDTLIQTTAGTFHSYIIRTGYVDSWYTDEYYTENVGRVGAYGIYKPSGSTVITKTTLLSFTVR